MKLLSLRVLLVLSLLFGMGTVHSVWVEASDASVNVSTDQWTGHSFTFLNLPWEEQADGYEIFPAAQAAQGLDGDRSVRLSYADHVGKQVDVTDVTPWGSSFTPQEQEYTVQMTVSDTGEQLVGRTMRGQLVGFVLTADLDNARQQFLGQTIYPKYRDLSGLFVPDSNTMPQAVALPIGSPVTVVDVYAGTRSQEPIRLVVDVNGEKAVIPLAYSWTNLPVENWTRSSAWQNALFMDDPHATLGGSPEVWKQIQQGNVIPGMTKDQVRLSWSRPDRVEDDRAVWIYENKKLNFDGNVLNSVEIVPGQTPS